MSIARTLSTDVNDFCGYKQLTFTLNGTVADQTTINATNRDVINFSPHADTKDFGIANAELFSYM